MSVSLRPLVAAAIAALSLTLAACTEGGYSRGIFQGHVVNKTEAEIVDRVGKPDEIERTNPDEPVLVYKKKTFDVDNENKVDPVTVVYMKKRPDGTFVSYDIGYRA